jgi:2-polyprenyl-6-methoxyphenol hydroxylase-like FAD-dependent oxidoreductase
MLAAAKKPTPVLREYFGAKLVTEIDYATVRRDPYPVSLPIFQQCVVRVLETALIEHGHRVEWSTRMMTFATDDDGVVAEVVRDGTRKTIRAKWLVGCDGGGSTVRRTLTPEFPGEPSGLQGLICECDLDWRRSRDIWWTWQTTGGLAAAIYNDFIGKWHVLIMEPGQPHTVPETSGLERVGQLLRQISGDRSVHASNPNWVHADISSSQRVAKQFIVGRALLVGDAAHVFSSAAGHGVHCAIEDALNLGWKLALTISGAAAPSLLGTYDAERRQHANDVIYRTRWVQRFLKLRGTPRKFLWGLIYMAGKHLRSIGSIASKQAEKLQTSYENSPLSRQNSGRPAPGAHVGLHVPDATCRVGGRASSLLEVIRGPEADLLLFTGLSPTPATVGALQVLEQSVAGLGKCLRVHYVFPSQAYANDAGLGEHDPRVIVDGLEKLHSGFGIREPELVYIRPDGYVGLRTRNLRKQALLGYLSLIYNNELIGPDGP